MVLKKRRTLNESEFQEHADYSEFTSREYELLRLMTDNVL